MYKNGEREKEKKGKIFDFTKIGFEVKRDEFGPCLKDTVCLKHNLKINCVLLPAKCHNVGVSVR